MRHHPNDWLDDWAGDDRPESDEEPDVRQQRSAGSERRTRRLRLLAVVPWLVVAGLLGAGQLTSQPPSPPPSEQDGHTSTSPVPVDTTGSQEAAAPAPGALPPPAEGPLGPGPVAIDTVRGAWRVGPEDGDAAALAVAVARAWLTGIEPRSALVGISPVADHTYVEHLAVEAVERPEPDAAVVTLLAVLLDRGADDGEHTVRISRLSVPIAFVDGRVRPAGSPWWVRPPDLRPVDLPREQVLEPELTLAALDALLDAGFEDPEVVSLASTPGWPWIATVTATAPDASAFEGEVWLRRHLERFAVAGTHLRPPADDPADDPAPVSRPAEQDQSNDDPGELEPAPDDPGDHDPGDHDPAEEVQP